MGTRELAARSDVYSLAAMLYEMLVGEPPYTGPTPQAVLAKVKERMQADYASDLHLEDLAACAGLTTFQLIGLFKRTVGLTPHAYLTQIRLAMACRHLRRSPALAEAATAVGFPAPPRPDRQFSPIPRDRRAVSTAHASLLS